MKLISVIIFCMMFVLIFLGGILFKREKISFQTFLFWSLIWVVMAFAFAFPNAINAIAYLFGMSNRMFFVFTISIVVLFLLTFYNFSSVKKIELMVIKLVQEVSLLASKVEEIKREQDESSGDDSSI